MTKGQPNLSWREQRKAVVAEVVNEPSGECHWVTDTEYPSLWQAAKAIAESRGVTFATARKEIRKAIAQGVPRYGAYWKWKE